MSKFIGEGLTFDDVLIIPKYSEVYTRADCSLFDNSISNIPILSANMDTITGIEMMDFMDKEGGIGVLHRYMPVEEMIDIAVKYLSMRDDRICCLSVGSLNNDKKRIDEILKLDEDYFPDIIMCVDLAHGHCTSMRETLEYIKNKSTISVIAGNVATREGAIDLFKWGAWVVKVGIGPGSVCTTRTKTGVGIPQLTAIMECSREGPIIADGGIKTPGDAAKALAAGAEAVMIGGMFAGTDMVPGWSRGKGVIPFRGMASKEAQEEFKGKYANEEGISTTIYNKGKGSTKQTFDSIVEGIKSAMSYVGARNLKEFGEKSQFIRVTSNTIVENNTRL